MMMKNVTVSAYTWLDRLRAAKGFPAEPDIALEDCVRRLGVEQQDRQAGLSMVACALKEETVTAVMVERCAEEDEGCPRDLRWRNVGQESNPNLLFDGACAMSDNGFSGSGNGLLDMLGSSKEKGVENGRCGRFQSSIFADLFGMNEPTMMTVKKKHKRKQEKPRLCPRLVDSVQFGCQTGENVAAHRSNHVESSSGKNSMQSSVSADLSQLRCDGNGSSNVRSELHVEDRRCNRGPFAKQSQGPSNVARQGKKNRTRKNHSDVSVTRIVGDGADSRVDLAFRRLECGQSALDGRCDWDSEMPDEYPQMLSSKSSSRVEGSASKRRNKVAEKADCGSKRKRGHISESSDGSHREVSSADQVPLVSSDAERASGNCLAADHPASQPEGSLIFSVYQVYMQAGKSGLTPREAVSRILEKGLPGLHEGGVVPRVQVAKIVQASPYFMELEESKFVLCSAIIGNDVHNAGRTSSSPEDLTEDSNQNARTVRQKGGWQYWAVLAALRRARTGKTRRREASVQAAPQHIQIKEPVEKVPTLQVPKKGLKRMKQEGTGLGNRCNRSDGKGWHCPLLAKVGYLLCDHHLAKLRSKSSSSGARKPLVSAAKDVGQVVQPGIPTF